MSAEALLVLLKGGVSAVEAKLVVSAEVQRGAGEVEMKVEAQLGFGLRKAPAGIVKDCCLGEVKVGARGNHLANLLTEVPLE